MATLLRGIDVSHWSSTIDWPTVRKQNVLFAISKATEGVDFLDSQWDENLNGCSSTKMPYGAYHFYRNNGKPVDQANWFMAHIPDPAYMPVVVCDVETTLAIALVGEYALRFEGKLRGAGLSEWRGAVTQAKKLNRVSVLTEVDAALLSLASDTKLFLERLRSEGYEPAIYSSPGFLASYFGNLTWLAEYPLWLAHIGVTKPSIPQPWLQYGDWPDNAKVPLWQDTWTLQVEGIPEAAVDGNLFTSAAGNLYDWFGNGELYEEPGVMPNAIRVNTPNSYANIRNKMWGTITGKAPHGMTLFVTDQATDTSGKLWYACGTGWVAGWIVEVIG